MNYDERQETTLSNIVEKLDILIKLLSNNIKEQQNGKECTDCGEWKKFTSFGIDTGTKDGLRHKCKLCYKSNRKQKRVIKNKYSKGSLIKKIYQYNIDSSKKKEHVPPDYTLQQLSDWTLDQEEFHILYNNWVKNDYDQALQPTVDRISNIMPITLTNARVITWSVNNS